MNKIIFLDGCDSEWDKRGLHYFYCRLDFRMTKHNAKEFQKEI